MDEERAKLTGAGHHVLTARRAQIWGQVKKIVIGSGLITLSRHSEDFAVIKALLNCCEAAKEAEATKIE